MEAAQIFKNVNNNLSVREDGQIVFQYGETRILLSPEQAVQLAKSLLEAVTYITTKINAAMEDVPNTLDETREAIADMQATAERFKELEQ